MTTHKATITMGRIDAPIVYEGKIWTTPQVFEFPKSNIQWMFYNDDIHLEANGFFPSREAALADAQAHGIDIVEE